MSLQINNLTKKFGEQTALNTINISIDKNEIIGLLGPNGAGKSTLMKSIVGALKIDEGEIIFNGKNISENEIESKKKDRFFTRKQSFVSGNVCEGIFTVCSKYS